MIKLDVLNEIFMIKYIFLMEILFYFEKPMPLINLNIMYQNLFLIHHQDD